MTLVVVPHVRLYTYMQALVVRSDPATANVILKYMDTAAEEDRRWFKYEETATENTGDPVT